MKNTNSPDEHDRLLVTIFMIPVVLMIICHFMKDGFLGLLCRLRLFELGFLAPFHSGLKDLAGSLSGYGGFREDLLAIISGALGEVLRLPVVCLLLVPACLAGKRAFMEIHGGSSGLEGLIGRMGRYFPAALCVRHPSFRGERLHASARTPAEWLEHHGLPAGIIPDEALVGTFLMRDLGPPWKGLEDLQDYHRGLLMVFLETDPDKRQKLTLEMARLSGGRKFRLSGYGAGCWKRFILSPDYIREVVRLEARHGYVSTLLMGALEKSRKTTGILPPADFLWLKRVDRPLWYALQNLGRKTCTIEAVAAMSRYALEGSGQGRPVSPGLPGALARHVISVLFPKQSHTGAARSPESQEE